MSLSDHENAEVEAEEVEGDYDHNDDVEAGDDSFGHEKSPSKDYDDYYKSNREKNIEDEIHSIKKKEEFQRIKKFDELQEANEENG